MTHQVCVATGLEMIEAEMSRQRHDALLSVDANEAIADEIADSVRRTGRVALLGMGGSHWVNRAAMFAYRDIGLEVQCDVLSEALFRPLPDRDRTVLLTSQSGSSGEIAAYLKTLRRSEERFGLTLNDQSVLARTVPSLIGAGGVEKAFAATRSIFVSHALHLSVLSALGYDSKASLDAIRGSATQSIQTALDALSNRQHIILSGRSELQGLAESGALCLMELARMATYALESGQLRHGPMEMLSAGTGVLIFRPPGAAAHLSAALALDCRAAGAAVVVFDTSGEAPLEDVITVQFSRSDGMAAVFDTLPTLQRLLVSVAAAKVANVGIPLRSSKVTTAL
jgi:fructoselysine-6-P-deglycase FrlB-like protein